MTNDEINRAIAEHLGWEWRPDKTAKHPRKDKWWVPPYLRNIEGCGCHTVPDFCNDLNAMHEATSTLMDGELVGYVDQLLCIIHEVDPGYFDKVDWFLASDLINITAHQRAEAFLKTVGKWKEEK